MFDFKQPLFTYNLEPNTIISNITDFFQKVQQETGFFKDNKGIYYHLYDKQKEWLTLFDEDKPQRRVLLGSRDKGKSEIVTILGASWALYNNPSIKIGIMSFKFENALKLVNQILKILSILDINLLHKAGGYYSNQSNSHTPNLMPLGLMSTVRGMHFDYLILDDPLTINEQFSKKYINRSRYFLNEGASLSKKIIIIGQLLTRNDIYYDAYGDSTGSYYLLQSWHGDIPELDKDIDYLRVTIGDKDVARNYLGYIDDKEEAIFKCIKFDNCEPSGNIFAFIDPSAKGRDYTAVCLGWVHDARIIVKGFLFKSHWGNCLDEVVDICKFAEITYFEDNQGVALGSFLHEKNVNAMGITTTANKIAKIYSLKGIVVSDRLRLCNSMHADAVMQIKDWTETAEYDDMPDCVSMLVQRIGWILN